MWESVAALIAKLDAGHIVVLLILGGREYVAWKEREMFSRLLNDGFPKIVEAMNGVKVMIAAITGKAQ